MATLYKNIKDKKLYLISYGHLGKFTGKFHIARPYNRSGDSSILDFDKKSPTLADFVPVAAVEHALWN